MLAQKCRLGLARRTRSEQSDKEPSEQLHEVDHAGTTLAHRCIGTTPDEIFGTAEARSKSEPAVTELEEQVSPEQRRGVRVLSQLLAGSIICKELAAR